jgi:hypothetical protein
MRLLLRSAECALAACLAALPVCAQSGAGMPPEWEVQKQLEGLSSRIDRLKAALDKTDPAAWAEKGASSAYADQGKRVQAELGYLLGSSKALAASPEKLTVALETWFRMQSTDALLRSYVEGVRRYQNEALADMLTALVAETADDRETLREYVMQLAATREREFKIADEEAARCRSGPARAPRPAPAKTPEKVKEQR